MQVVKASDVLFLFGSLADIRDTIKSIKGDLKGHQIVVPVTKEGDLDVFQVNADSACFVSDIVPPDMETLFSVLLVARAVLHSCEHTTLTLVCVFGHSRRLQNLFDVDSRHVTCHTFPHL